MVVGQWGQMGLTDICFVIDNIKEVSRRRERLFKAV